MTRQCSETFKTPRSTVPHALGLMLPRQSGGSAQASLVPLKVSVGESLAKRRQSAAVATRVRVEFRPSSPTPLQIGLAIAW